jgi:hypothetical protein
LIQSPLIIVDTTGCGFHEEMVETKNAADRSQNKKGADAEDETKGKRKPMMLGEGSKANQGEADLVHHYVHTLLQQGSSLPCRSNLPGRLHAHHGRCCDVQD